MFQPYDQRKKTFVRTNIKLNASLTLRKLNREWKYNTEYIQQLNANLNTENMYVALNASLKLAGKTQVLNLQIKCVVCGR